MITVTDDEVIIDSTDYVKLDGYCQHLQELYRTLHQLRSHLETKTLRFLFDRDCQPIRLLTFDRVLEHIATTYQIPQHRMILQMWDHYPRNTTPWATVKTFPSTNWVMAQQHVNIDQCAKDPDAKLFGGFYGRFTPHRFLMSYFLETEFPDQSVVSFHPGVKWAEHEFAPVRNWYDKEFEWLHARADRQLSKLVPGYNGRIDMYVALQDYHNVFKLCHIEVVLETNAYDHGWFSEKTTRCLCSGKPFLLMGSQGQLDHLRQIGFKTFSPWINESYNNEPDTEKRFDMICDEIRRIASLPADQQHELVQQLDSVAIWNKNNYNNILNEYVKQFN